MQNPLEGILNWFVPGRQHRWQPDKARKLVDKIEKLESKLLLLTDEQLMSCAGTLRDKIRSGTALAKYQVEGLALCREACRRAIGLRAYPVQLMASIALQARFVVEMRTGEGKSLAILIAACLEAFAGKGVHVVTANDYLARRDALSATKALALLGMTCGCSEANQSHEEKKQAYLADVTYSTASEIAFDYLRDSLAPSLEAMVQRPAHFAIIDEADAILIDEAMTPFVLSGPGESSVDIVKITNEIIKILPKSCYVLDLKARSIHLTDIGLARVEGEFTNLGLISRDGHLHDIAHMHLSNNIHQALRAWWLFRKDIDYVVQDGKIALVDALTGRIMDGRRWSEGLHQAVEAKEDVEILEEHDTMASITCQNLFRAYPSLSGTTGTALDVSIELSNVYGVLVIKIPTNKPMIRIDEDDRIFMKSHDRDKAVLDLIMEAHKINRPVLVGTTSVVRSESLSRLLDGRNLPHRVLNALRHHDEAMVIAQAGKLGAITIATSMAGRGTDILLGGNNEFEELTNRDEDAGEICQLGGLLVIGTERNESRRVDDQLRGRAGRQGDPGSSVFMISLEDDLFRRYGVTFPPSVTSLFGDTDYVSHSWLSSVIRKAQKRIEDQQGESRMSLLRYDGHLDRQRRLMRKMRHDIMTQTNFMEKLDGMTQDAIEQMVDIAMPVNSFPEQWDREGLKVAVIRVFNLNLMIEEWLQQDGVSAEAVSRLILNKVLEARNQNSDPEEMVDWHRTVFLGALDMAWKQHVGNMEILRRGIHLRAYGQRDPLHEWQKELAEGFSNMLDEAASYSLTIISKTSFNQVEVVEQPRLLPREADVRVTDAHYEVA
jgi:preprotein translocase subunit SecA